MLITVKVKIEHNTGTAQIPTNDLIDAGGIYLILKVQEVGFNR